MFETLEDLNKTLPRPQMDGNPQHDLLVQERYISNAKTLRSEAFACIGRSLVKAVKHSWRQLTTWDRQPHAHGV